jgi:PAS domain S-box-containing protein
MSRSIAALADALLVPEADVDLRARYYQTLCLLSGLLVTLVIVPINVAQQLPPIVSIAAMTFGLVTLALYGAARRGYYFPGFVWLALMVTLNVIWFPNAGSHGSIVFFFFPAALFVVAFFRGATRWALVAAVLVNYLLLLLVEQQHPEWAIPFRTAVDRPVDLASGFFGSLAAVVLMTWVIVGVYDRDRRRVEETAAALAASREQFSAIFELNPDVVTLLDAETEQCLAINEGFERLTGWTRADVVGNTTASLGLWVDPRARAQMYERLRGGSHVRGYLARLRLKDGRAVWASISASRVTIGGRPCVLTTARDVSAEIHAQRALAESRVMRSTFLNSTDDMLWMVQPEGFRLTIFNDAFARHIDAMYGVRPVDGMGPDDVLPPALAETWKGYYARAIDDGAFAIEYSTSSERALLLAFNPVTLDGTLLGVSVFARDITPLKLAEDERDRMRLQFLHAQKMDSLGSLAGGVAHDFNNMLGGIMGYADLLLATDTDPARREQIQSILRAAARSSDLTRKLLAFARRGKNIVEAVDLNATVRESLTMLGPAMRAETELTTALQARYPVDGDPTQLNQLVVNLCLNAHEAMPAGGRLTVTTADVAVSAHEAAIWPVPHGDYVELRVTDTGVGMSEEVRERIFEPFFTTKSGGDVSGTGLGLSTVYGVVHLHRGAIRVDSSPGNGTTLRCAFREARFRRPRRPRVRPRRPAAGSSSSSRTKKCCGDWLRRCWAGSGTGRSSPATAPRGCGSSASTMVSCRVCCSI